MTKTLDAVLAVARERFAGNPAGRNTGSPKPTTLGDDPGVDYAPKSGDERKFVAKHTHIEQEYPNGMAAVFKGEPTKYSLDDVKMSRYGNKQGEAKSAYEQTEVVADPKTANKPVKTKVKQNNDTDDDDDNIGETTKEELEVSEAHPMDHKNVRGMTVNHLKSNRIAKAHGDFKHGAKEYNAHKTASKSDMRSAASAAVAAYLAKGKRVHKEEVEQVDEVSSKKLDSYRHKAHDQVKKGQGKSLDKREKGRQLAHDKLTGRAKVSAKEEVEIEETWKASQNEKGEHIVKHKSGKVLGKTYGSKGEAIDAAVRKNKVSGAFKEELGVDEKLAAGAPASEYIHDFVHSKDKKFEGDSKGQRIKRALGAFYNKEEVEDIEEVWKATQNEKGEHVLKHKSGKVSSKTYSSKGEAIDAAVRRNKVSGAFKEDIEPVDEVSMGKLKDYHQRSKAHTDHLKSSKTAIHNVKTYLKRSGGQERAERLAGKKALSKEEVEPMNVEEGILTDKNSLGRKMEYHKGKIKNEDIGSIKFKHHQKQIHIIKGMLEEFTPDIVEVKVDQGFVYKKDKKGFLVKKRRYGKDNKKPAVLGKNRTWEDVEMDPQVARIFEHMNKEKF